MIYKAFSIRTLLSSLFYNTSLECSPLATICPEDGWIRE